MRHRLCTFALMAIGLLAGCAGGPDHVVFVTKTSLGVDVEQTPPSASIAYDRVEGYFGPRFDNSAVPPVLASFTTNGELFNRDVKQIYATGNAARIITDPDTQVKEPDLGGDKYKGMFFGTGTTVGLKIGYEAGGSTSTLTFGYKRKELSVIPVTTAEFPSVLATLETDSKAPAIGTTAFGVGQLFATGSAATAIARRPEVRDLFRERTDTALGVFRAQEREQSRHALVTLSCMTSLADDMLPKVWNNAEALDVLDKAAEVGKLGQLPAPAARDRYARFLAILNADSQDTTVRMALHRQYVCGLAGR